jgi:hypothetical protein
MKNARLFGLLFILMGGGLASLLCSMLDGLGGAMRILYAGPLLVGMGLGMLILPGYQPTDEEWADKKKRFPLIWGNAPILNKVVWIGLGVGAMALIHTGIIRF